MRAADKPSPVTSRSYSWKLSNRTTIAIAAFLGQQGYHGYAVEKDLVAVPPERNITVKGLKGLLGNVFIDCILGHSGRAPRFRCGTSTFDHGR